jgi:ATP/ADP translocase
VPTTNRMVKMMPMMERSKYILGALQINNLDYSICINFGN